MDLPPTARRPRSNKTDQNGKSQHGIVYLTLWIDGIKGPCEFHALFVRPRFNPIFLLAPVGPVAVTLPIAFACRSPRTLGENYSAHNPGGEFSGRTERCRVRVSTSQGTSPADTLECSKRNEEVASIRMAATGLELRIKSPLPQRQISSFQFRSISSCSLT
jgi:hypothetical protein